MENNIGIVVQCAHVIILPCKRGTFVANRNDHIMTPSLAMYGEYAEDELEILGRYVKPGMVVIDVGANIGIHSVSLSDMVGKDGLVVSFEPVLCSYNLLCANIAFSGNQNVVTHRAMVGDVDRPRYLRQLNQTQRANYGMFNAIKESSIDQSGGGIPTPEITIDSLYFDRCDLIKIDVEGSELAVLSGSLETIKKHDPVIQVECNVDDKENEASLVPLLKELGYQLFWLRNRFYRPNNHKGSTSYNPGEDRNILAVKEKDIRIAEGLEKIQ